MVAGLGVVAAFGAVAPSASAQVLPQAALDLSFVAGDQAPGPPVEGPATSSHLDEPIDLAFDPAGNLYVADSNNCTVEKVTPAGTLSIFVGTIDGCVPRNGTASDDEFVGLAWWNGNLYISGADRGYIYKADSDGDLTIVAGSGGQGSPSDGPGLAQQFTTPTQMVAYNNALYFGDKDSHKVVKLDLVTFMVTIIGGDGGVSSPPSPLQPATLTSIDAPSGIAVDHSGTVYVADNNAGEIFRISSAGILLGSFSHPAPFGIAFDPTGTVLYVASVMGTISAVDPLTGESVIVAGIDMSGASTGANGQTSMVMAGPALATHLGLPFGVEVATNGDIYSSLVYPGLVVKLTKQLSPVPPFNGPEPTAVPIVDPSATPSVSPSGSPSVSPSVLPSGSPSAVPSVSPSVAPPSVVPTSAAPPSEVPTAPDPVFTQPAPVPTDTASPPRINLNLALTVDALLAGAKATVSGGGLQPESLYVLTMNSTPIEVARGTTNASGAFNAVITIPAKACVTGGSHRLVLTGTAPGGGKLEDSSYVVLDDTCRAKHISNIAAPVNNTVTLQSFTFPRLSAKLRPKALRTLNDLNGALAGAKAITITGYTETDSKGKAANKANKRLALKRAKAVRAQLRKLGVTVPIAVRGAGGVKGLGKGQKFNRRVVIIVRF